MKKLLAIILAAVMMLSMAACGNSTDTEDNSSNDNKDDDTKNQTNEDSLFVDKIEECFAEYSKEDDQFEYEFFPEEECTEFIEDTEEDFEIKLSGEIGRVCEAMNWDKDYYLCIMEFKNSSDADIMEETLTSLFAENASDSICFRKGDVVMYGDPIMIETLLERLGIEAK